MKTTKFAIPAAVLLFSLSSLQYLAGQSSVFETRVSAIIDRFPAADFAERDALSAEIIGLGPAGILFICDRLRPPGEGDSSKAEFALNGLAVYVARPGAEGERLSFVKTLLKALGREQRREVKAFLISQIELTGKKEAIKALAKQLNDESLSGPASRALVAIGGPEAEKALLKALGAVSDLSKLAVIQALGELRSSPAAGKLHRYAVTSSEGLRKAALDALANIGDPASSDLLASTRVAASAYERARAPSLYLRYAERLIASGHRSRGLEICRELLESYTGSNETHIASMALGIMASTLDTSEILPDLIAAMDSPHPQFRGAALTLAHKFRGAETTAAWITKLGSASPQARAEIISFLGDGDDEQALPAVREFLKSPVKDVRISAITAAARLGGEQVLADLLQILERGSDGDEIGAAKFGLLGLPGSVFIPKAVRLMESAPPPGRIALLEILSEKAATDQIGLVFDQIDGGEPAVRAAGIQALAALANEGDLPRILSLLYQAEAAPDVVGLQNAVAAAVLRISDPERRAEVILGFLRAARDEDKPAVLRTLPRIGGEPVLRAVVQETGNATSQVRTAAVYALSRWPDFEAAAELFRIAASAEDRRHVLLATEGYTRLVGRSGLSAEKKLDRLKALLGLSIDDADKKAALRGLVPLRSPEAFKILSGYLGNPALGAPAAQAVFEIASVQSAEERWLSGHEAVSILRRAEDAIEDHDEKEKARAIIDDRLRQGGFRPLFNGRDLLGWKGLAADPARRAQMTAEELRKAQAEADLNMQASWKSSDGLLLFDGNGQNLVTVGEYGDFELLVDWKIEKGGDSGIYLRGIPQVQIWDAEANPAGSGGLYNNQLNPSLPLEKADRPAGEWNTFRIIMIGDRVTVYLNDRMVVGNTILENYWERDSPISATGPIELQAHGNPLSFRNLYIREIPEDSEAPRLSDGEKAEGFVPLFNGTDLSGWTGDTQGYALRNGKIVVDPEKGSGNLYTEREYKNFVLRFDFKLTPGANNGLGIRSPLEGDAAYAGMELQILEDGSPLYWNLKPYQYHGSIYGIVPARRGVLKPPGEWNFEEVNVSGRRVTVAVNGTTIVDADLDGASAGGTMDGRDHPGLKRESGHIGFLGHGSVVEFRNIRIRELDGR